MSKSVQVSIRFVDGGYQELTEGQKLLSVLSRLQHQGLEGKALIHALLTDDWGPPPVVVNIKGTDELGHVIDVQIPYR